MDKIDLKKEIEILRADIQKRKADIENLQKTVNELSAKIQSSEEKGKPAEMDSMLKDVSGLVNSSFNVLGLSGGRDSPEGKEGLIGLINGLARLAEQSQSFQKEFELGGKRGVIDFQVRAGPLKGPGLSRGSLYRKPPGRRVEPILGFSPTLTGKPADEREPILDIIEGDGKLTVLVEFPGVKEKDIKWDVEGQKFTLNIESENIKCSKEVVLPYPVQREGAKSSFKNGILEIELRKTPEKSSET